MTQETKTLPELKRVWDDENRMFAAATLYDEGHPEYLYAKFGDREGHAIIYRDAATEEQVNRIFHLLNKTNPQCEINPAEITQ